jgi:hypothetical protein
MWAREEEEMATAEARPKIMTLGINIFHIESF